MGQTIGIDFGTTTTEVSYVRDDFPYSVKLDGANYYIPTAVLFKSETEIEIGEAAEFASRNLDSVQAVVKNFKLDLADKHRSYHIIVKNGEKKIEFDRKPQQIVQLFLNKVLSIVQPQLISVFGAEEGRIEKAVVTVPAQFNPIEKEAIKKAIAKAAKRAGFSDIKVVAEPTAAAVAYSDSRGIENNQSVLVYDFGGGTFDVSVIRKENDKFIEVETDGDKALGGTLLTEKIGEWLWEECLEKFRIRYLPFSEEDIDDYDEEEETLKKEKIIKNRAEVLTIAENMKRKLLKRESVGEAVNFYCPDGEEKTEWLELTREKFNQIIEKYIDKTLQITADVVKRTEGKIDYLVLAGGSSQIRFIKEKIKNHEILSKLKFSEDEDSQTMIARGAAILAHSQLATEEKTRFELGICERIGADYNAFIPIIDAGVKLPCSGKRIYPIENRNSIKISYCEKDVKKYPNARRTFDDGIEEVSEMEIDLPDGLEGASIEVIFNIEKDGTPTISANVLAADGKVIVTDQIVIKRGELI